jgi:F-type H+-transporting ATPase subunit b
MIVAHLVFVAAEHAEKIQTKHSWLPEWYEIVFGGFAFLVVAALLVKLAFPQLGAALKKRSERIATELERSREDKENAATEAAAIRAQLGDVSSETGRILTEADETAARMLVEGNERTKAEIAELEANNRAEIAAIRARVAADVRAYVAAWASRATDEVVATLLDDSARERLLEAAITQIATTR